ncbi:MAG: hypothetical protein NXI14_14025 [bacterium]|nr:hypothetical protein [bacterium]
MTDTTGIALSIIRCFDQEARDGHEGVEVFLHGAEIAGLSLDPGELVYGGYESTFYFTPKSLIIAADGEVTKIPWEAIRMCSSVLEANHKWSVLLLNDFRRVEIELCGRWQGRIGELYHSMIERMSGITCGREGVMTIREFFGQVRSEDELMPNLMVHPGLDAFRSALDRLEEELPGTILYMLMAAGDPGTATGVVAVTEQPKERFERFAREFGADGVIEADQIVPVDLLHVPDSHRVWHIVWD